MKRLIKQLLNEGIDNLLFEGSYNKLITIDRDIIEKLAKLNTNLANELNKEIYLVDENIYAKGGAARLALLLYVDMINDVDHHKNDVIRDSDFVYIGDYDNYIKVTSNFVNNDNDEIDYEGKNFSEYFNSRDISLNEVLLNRNKFIFTRRALRDASRKVINPSKPNYSEISSRLSSRILLFASRYDSDISPNIKLSYNESFIYLIALLKAYELGISNKFFELCNKYVINFKSVGEWLLKDLIPQSNIEFNDKQAEEIANDIYNQKDDEAIKSIFKYHPNIAKIVKSFDIYDENDFKEYMVKPNRRNNVGSLGKNSNERKLELQYEVKTIDYIKQKLSEGLIVEGASPILYHFTNVSRLDNILDTNSFYLTPAVSASEKTKNKNYFMSLSRSKSTAQGYGSMFRTQNSVRIKVDGTKLGYNYKVMSVDYWQYPKTPEYMKQGSGDEMEDRVVSDNNEIPNASKFIISIDVFAGDEINDSLINKAKELGIQVNFYDNVKDFTSGDPNKRIEPKTNNNNNNDETRPISFYSIQYTIGALTYKNVDSLDGILNELKGKFGASDKFIGEVKEGVVNYHKKLSYYLRVGDEMNLVDLTNSLSAELSNVKTSSDKLTRYITSLFLKDLKITNSKTIKDYLNYKLYLGKKTQTDFNKEFNDKMINIINEKYIEAISYFNYSVYNEDTRWENLYMYEPAKKFLDFQINKIKEYVSNYILNNNNMYRDVYLLNSSEIIEYLGLKDDNEEAFQITNTLQDVGVNELINPLMLVTYEINDAISKEVSQIRSEDNSQWLNENKLMIKASLREIARISVRFF